MPCKESAREVFEKAGASSQTLPAKQLSSLLDLPLELPSLKLLNPNDAVIVATPCPQNRPDDYDYDAFGGSPTL